MTTPTAFWDKIADRYSRQPVSNPAAYDQTLDRVRAYLHPDDHLLELGCGTGTTALRLRDAVAQVTASDVSGEMIRIAQAKADAEGADTVTFVKADVCDSDGRTYDVVAGFNLFHLVDDAPAAFKSVASRLKPGGYFISKTPMKPGAGAPLWMKLMLLALPLLQWIGKAPHVTFLSEDELHRAIEAAGFKIVETGNYPVTPPNHFVVAQKPSQ